MNWKPIAVAIVTILAGVMTMLGKPLPNDLIEPLTDQINAVLGAVFIIGGAVHWGLDLWKKRKESK